MKKYLVLFAAVSFLGTGCKDKFAEGLADGQASGISKGNSDGRRDGLEQGFNNTYQASYNSEYDVARTEGKSDGLRDGQAYYTTNDNYGDGYSDGFNDNYDAGATDGFDDGYATGFSPAYDSGYLLGEDDGFADGQADGAIAGAEDGAVDGYDAGFSDTYDVAFGVSYDNGANDGFADGDIAGYDSGFSAGYDDGFAAGLGSSLNSKNPSVKLAALVNSELIDYQSLTKFESASGTLSHTDNGSMDMEKLAALKEQHFINQMGSQISNKFGLDSDRAISIAKVAHQFNSVANSRALTEKDAELFSNNVIGVSLKAVEAATKKSLKGDSTDLNSLMTQIATHNKTSPEKMNQIISEIFF